MPILLITGALKSHSHVQVANFLKNDRVESLLLGTLPSLSDSLRVAAGSFLGEEGQALLQVRMLKNKAAQLLPCPSCGASSIGYSVASMQDDRAGIAVSA